VFERTIETNYTPIHLGLRRGGERIEEREPERNIDLFTGSPSPPAIIVCHFFDPAAALLHKGGDTNLKVGGGVNALEGGRENHYSENTTTTKKWVGA